MEVIQQYLGTHTGYRYETRDGEAVVVGPKQQLNFYVGLPNGWTRKDTTGRIAVMVERKGLGRVALTRTTLKALVKDPIVQIGTVAPKDDLAKRVAEILDPVLGAAR